MPDAIDAAITTLMIGEEDGDDGGWADLGDAGADPRRAPSDASAVTLALGEDDGDLVEAAPAGVDGEPGEDGWATTLAIGEEDDAPEIIAKDLAPVDDGWATTLAIGEEDDEGPAAETIDGKDAADDGGWATTMAIGEEDGEGPATEAVGEDDAPDDGGWATTMAIGEEDDAPLDFLDGPEDPEGPMMTTLAIGEEDIDVPDARRPAPMDFWAEELPHGDPQTIGPSEPVPDGNDSGLFGDA